MRGGIHLVEEKNVLKDFTLFQYRLIGRYRLKTLSCIVHLSLLFVGIVIARFYNHYNFLQCFSLFGIICVPYVILTILHLFVAYFSNKKLQYHLSLLSLISGISIIQSLLTKRDVIKVEISLMFYSTIVIIGLYVWIPSYLWIFIILSQCLLVAQRFMILLRLRSLPEDSWIRYEPYGFSHYLTNGK